MVPPVRAELVSIRLVADLETPVAAMLKLVADRPYSFLLELVEGGAVRGRYSIIGLDPDILWRAHGDRAEINASPLEDVSAFRPCEGGTLERASSASRCIPRRCSRSTLPPMSAGVFGYLGYDTVRLVERLPAQKPDPIGVPDALLMRPTIMVIFDAVKDEMTIVTTVRPQKTIAAKTAYSRAIDRLTQIQDALETKSAHASSANGLDAAFTAATSNMAPEDYMAHGSARQRVHRQQAIFSRSCSRNGSLRGSICSPLPFIAPCDAINPAPFLYFLNFGSFAVAGSSPEILVRVREGEVTIRPIAGTRPRGATPEEDKRSAAELLADTKERAEHLMLLDLGPQRRGPRRRNVFGARHRQLLPGVLQPGHAHRLQRGRAARRAARFHRRAYGRLSGGHRIGRAESPRHGDHRRLEPEKRGV